MDDITTKLAEIAVAKEKLDAPAAAAPAANSNDAMLASAQELLTVGKALIAEQDTQAQGLRDLNTAIKDAAQVAASAAATSQQKASAMKIEHEAIDAIIAPMKEQLDIGKALIESDGNRSEGLRLIARADVEAQRIAAMHGATLKEVAAAMALKHDAEMALLEPMHQDLELGTALVENARTEAQGITKLNQTVAEATAVINSHHPSLTALADACKTLRDAQAALMKPMEDEIDLGRDLMGQEDTRAMGVAKLTEAQGSLLRMIAENANNPQLLAKSWDDLRKVQEAVFNAISKDVSDGAILIASNATRAAGVNELSRAEEELNFKMHDKSAKIDDVARAQRELNAVQVAMLIPLTQQVDAAREMAEGTRVSAAVFSTLAQAQADVEAKLTTLTPGTEAYKIAQRDLTEVLAATIMKLEEQTKLDEKGSMMDSQRAATLVKLGADEAALKKLLDQTNLSLEERKKLEEDLKKVEEKTGDSKSAAADAVEDDLKAATDRVTTLMRQFGVHTGESLNESLDSGIKAAFSGKDPMKAMGTSLLSSMGNIFSQMGNAMVTQGLIMVGLEPALANPFTMGPAALAVGVLLSALGATLGGIMQGDSSSGGGGSYGKNAPQTTNTTYFQTGAGSEAGGVSPQPAMPNVTIIGHNDPQAQRDLGRMMVNMSQRGIAMG
jgi:hypothetical protein